MDAERPRLNFAEYAIEGMLLGLFMISAGVITTLIERPGSAWQALMPDPVARRGLIGVAMGLTAITLIYSPWGKRSGAHFNPAVTLTFARLGKVRGPDVVGYIAGQSLGAILGTAVLVPVLGTAFLAPPVSGVVTVPGAAGAGFALLAEYAISFGLMLAVLLCSNSRRAMPYTGLVAGALVALWILIEGPYSGMSMNPARTLGSAVVTGNWTGFWIYLVAPLGGMLTAAEVWQRAPGVAGVLCAKLQHDHGETPCPFICGYCEARKGAVRSILVEGESR